MMHVEIEGISVQISQIYELFHTLLLISTYHHLSMEYVFTLCISVAMQKGLFFFLLYVSVRLKQEKTLNGFHNLQINIRKVLGSICMSAYVDIRPYLLWDP